MIKVLIVGFGGFLGTVFRYIISCSTAKFFGNFPLGTFLVNVLGGFIMGFLMEASTSLFPMSPNLRMFLTTGFLGGLTTFSTFSFETVSFISEGAYFMGGLNACLNLFLALSACWTGKFVAQLL
ncbi:MAG: fluoride efflux transporter CrcB [Clostridiales bacterium]|jgi:fluoride exporter|nr:fluoride efflux transporter CrcB [Clostridiales bacterium]